MGALPNHSVLVNDGGLIQAILPTEEMDKYVESLVKAGRTVAKTVDCTGKCVLPGFVDTHTHAVFAGDRCHEMKMKLAGATYVEVHKAGGGINFTVKTQFFILYLVDWLWFEAGGSCAGPSHS